MTEPARFQLIEGVFAHAEARHVLLSLVRSKIHFHELQLHSDVERFGIEREHSKKRLEELKTMEAALRQYLDAAEGAGQKLSLNGWIEVTPLG
jgi:hypothetical protein